ncbi:rhodanese-like domain-containing protein [Lysinibacillus fusiformis]|uniref:rhodanese-like domain-containing protein n=1 Tax=Lysinibacillus fusiformis TaxID=28031 RepID=UPI000D339891|nr:MULTISPECIES: rhodanese-like domain-containing protein [Lysinibacillus]MED4670308.1 rhodanese-like domain-containing protein [Lysinibacillus fusiformis]QAS56566.1 rhodanese-like domain-containing protein [Lysinibacillus sphaericus]RDV30387.1 rhodanese-like domain-containing protein [Lysinibacillus fusiformis]GED65341.1 rhodanese-like domain-containing protein [Lysinibacillus fusiformis]
MDILITIGVVLVVVIAYIGINALRLKKAVTNLTQEQFIEGYRKAQLIDVREQKEFYAGHILGARNVPSTTLRQRYKEIRPDLPVYLYCQNTGRSSRAALFLKKRGYNQIYQLQGGFKTWTGKIKAKKY